MRILHVVAGLAPSGGGLAELVPMFAREAAASRHEVVLATVARQGEPLAPAVGKAAEAGVRVVRFEPCAPLFLYFSAAMLRGLKALVAWADVVHVHSNWTFPVWWACHLALAGRKTLVMSPQGCLDPVRLRHSAWKKRLAGILDRHYLRRADVVHATSRAEAEGVENYLGSGRRIVMIPNGVEVEAFAGAKRREDLVQRWPECGGKKVALFQSRLHPLKGLDLLVGAWKDVAGEFGDWHLLIAGPDENGYEAEVRRMVQRADVASRVTFCGPLYGEEKTAVMRAVDLFVLPTRHENFGIVVAEALASGVPVITTRGAPWSELLGNEEFCKSEQLTVNSEQLTVNSEALTVNSEQSTVNSGRCGWWVEVGVEPLAGALREAMALSAEERREMGRNGRRLVEEKYTWKKAAAMMMAVYEATQGAVHV